jgi:hypothetical protein
MDSQKSLPLRRAGLLGLAIFLLTISVFAQSQQSKSAENRSRYRRPISAIGLEITSPHRSQPIFKGTSTVWVFDLPSIAVIDREAAKGFNRVMLTSREEKDSVKVRLLMQNAELVGQEWQTRNEKEIGSYTLAVGDSVTPEALLAYGIQPFTIKAISNKPVILKPEEYPRLFNFANILEVTEVEKSLDGYRFAFKNISGKKIYAYELWTGDGGVGQSSSAAQETIEEENHFSASEIEKHGLTLKLILFEDRTYEGDAKIAARYFAAWEGEAVQAAELLQLIEQTAQVPAAELPEAFAKLESGLWQMQEAMDKASAIDYLKSKYSSFDDETISQLYEQFKGGFYMARNTAIRPLEQGKRLLKEREEIDNDADRLRLINDWLSEAKRLLEKLTAPIRGR